MIRGTMIPETMIRQTMIRPNNLEPIRVRSYPEKIRSHATVPGLALFDSNSYRCRLVRTACCSTLHARPGYRMAA
jgi:hypothetical protein